MTDQTPPYGEPGDRPLVPPPGGEAPPPPAPPAAPYAPYPQGYGSEPPYPAYGAPQAPGYGSPQFGAYGALPQTHGGGQTSMILGICALPAVVIAGCCFGPAALVGVGLGIAAIVTGRKARAEIDAAPQQYANRGQAVAGFVMGIVATALGSLVAVGSTLVMILSVANGW